MVSPFGTVSLKSCWWNWSKVWLYFYGVFVSLLVHLLSHPEHDFWNIPDDINQLSQLLKAALFVGLFFGSVGGLAVAAILKLFDNVVKEYTGSFANILTSVIFAILFPNQFAFSIYIFLSMSCLLTGIYLYESNKTFWNGPFCLFYNTTCLQLY